MNAEDRYKIALLEIGQNLIIGDIAPSLRDVLSEEDALQITEIRNRLGMELINRSGLPNCTDWKILIDQLCESKPTNG